MWPLTIYDVTYAFADFHPFGYVAKLPESIGKIHYQLNTAMSTELGGTGASVINTLSPTSVSIVMPVDLNLSNKFLVSKLSDLTDTCTVTLSSYTRSTKTAIGTVPSVPSYMTWTVTPLVEPLVPALVCFGGTGGQPALKSEAGLAYPFASSQLVYEDFAVYLNPSFSHPWNIRTVANGADSVAVTTVSVKGADTYPTGYCGLLKFTVTGSSSPSGLDADRFAYDTGALVSYGSGGYLNPLAGGSISFKARACLEAELTGGTSKAFRAGLKGCKASNSPDFLNYFSLGFEASAKTDAGAIAVVIAAKSTVTKIPTGFFMAAETFVDFEIFVSQIEKRVYWYVDGVEVYQTALNWKLSVDVLMSPAVSLENRTTDTMVAHVDFIRCGQKVNRG